MMYLGGEGFKIYWNGMWGVAIAMPHMLVYNFIGKKIAANYLSGND